MVYKECLHVGSILDKVSLSSFILRLGCHYYENICVYIWYNMLEMFDDEINIIKYITWYFIFFAIFTFIIPYLVHIFNITVTLSILCESLHFETVGSGILCLKRKTSCVIFCIYMHSLWLLSYFNLFVLKNRSFRFRYYPWSLTVMQSLFFTQGGVIGFDQTINNITNGNTFVFDFFTNFFMKPCWEVSHTLTTTHFWAQDGYK